VNRNGGKKIIITGGSGFLGTKISELLLSNNCDVVSLDISPPKNNKVDYIECNLAKDTIKSEWFDGVFTVINLAGAPIFGKWTEAKKKAIYNSRVMGTKKLVAVLSETDVVNFVSASAVGVYGDRGNELLHEKSRLGDIEKSFLTKVSRHWEHEASQLKSTIQTTIIRNGHILGEKGLVGVLKPFYKWGIGGPLGDGKQWFPWVHIDDCAQLYVQAALQDTNESDALSVKVINAVVGEPITNKTFSKVFAKVLHRPHMLFIPKFALKILYGDFADEMMYSQKIASNVTNMAQYKDIYIAMKDILNTKSKIK